MSTVRSAVHPLKATCPITFTPSRITASRSPVQFQNEKVPIFFTFPGITILRRL